MIFWKNCLFIAWMLPQCVLGLSLSSDMTMIVSIAFGSLLLIIIIAGIIGCIYVWFNKKQDMDIMEENSSSRRNRLRRLNSIHPTREISMAEFEYLHNKSRAEYAMMSGALPGYLDSEESALHPEFRANGNNRRSSPPPPYDHNQERPCSIASAPHESDLPPLPATSSSGTSDPNTSTAVPQNSSSTSTSWKNTRNTRSNTITERKENGDVNSKTQSKKNQKAARIINVEDPDKLRLKKISLANKLKHEIETGERSHRQTGHENDRAHERESNEIEGHTTQQYQDGNDGYTEATPRHSRANDKRPPREKEHSKQMGNEQNPGRETLSDMPLRDNGKSQNGSEQQPKSSRTTAEPLRDDRHNLKEQQLQPSDRSPRIQRSKKHNEWVSRSGASENTNARSRRSGSYQDDYGEDNQYQHDENSHFDDN